MGATKKLRVALIGGGLGGMTAALALARHGFEAHVFEQSPALAEVGAGISLTPNGVKVLIALGLEKAVIACGVEPDAIIGRDWRTARSLFHVPLKGVDAARFGAPTVNLHRADLLRVLVDAVAGQFHPDNRCTALAYSDREAIVTLNGCRHESFDLVVGCDGIRSTVRRMLHEHEAPRFTGNMCWRALIPTAELPDGLLAPRVTLWVGTGGHVVTFPIRRGSLINLVAVRETDAWVEESWSVEASPAELVAAYHDIHPDLRAVLKQTDRCLKWGLFDLDPLLTWGKQCATLLGDAAHPMLPFLGQGAAMAMEDGFVFARELARSPDDVASD